MDAARKADGGQLRRNTMALATVAGVAVLAVLLGPAFLRSAAKALLMVSQSIEAAAPYRLEVKPGNATVPKGADQTVITKLLGFTTEDVTSWRGGTPTAAFEELPVIHNEDGTFEGILFDVMAPLDYYDRRRREVERLHAEGRRGARTCSASISNITTRPIPVSRWRRSRTAVTSRCSGAPTCA
jgi:hypothetical protein